MTINSRIKGVGFTLVAKETTEELGNLGVTEIMNARNVDDIAIGGLNHGTNYKG